MIVILKQKCRIGEAHIGNPGETLVITDAVPSHGESYSDVDGYCDIKNVATSAVTQATWLDVGEILSCC